MHVFVYYYYSSRLLTSSVNRQFLKVYTTCDSLDSVTDTYVPKVTIKSRNEREPFWFNTKARRMVSKQRKIYNNYKKTADEYHLSRYKECRREFKKQLKQIQEDHMRTHLYAPLSSGDSKAFYSFIKAKSEVATK